MNTTSTGPASYRGASEDVEPLLVELEIDAGQGSSTKRAITLLSVRMSRARLILKDYTVYAAITHAEIHVSSIPPAIGIRNRVGDGEIDFDASVEARLTRTSQNKHAITGTAKLAAKLSGATSGLQGGITATTAASKKRAATLVAKSELPLVRARGDGRWSIATFDNEIPLEGRILKFAELCLVETASPIAEISVTIEVPKSNIIVEKVTENRRGNVVKLDKGRTALLRALMARKLGTSGDAITMSIGRLSPT